MMVHLIKGDTIEVLKTMPDETFDLVIADPPYNIGVAQTKSGKKIKFAWDKISNYKEWCIEWLTECARILKPSGVLYMWHNDMEQIAGLLAEIQKRVPLEYVSFCIWNKGEAYRAQSWHNLRPEKRGSLRSWFNTCEYCLHFFKQSDRAKSTGLEMVYSNPKCFQPLKDWYKSELIRLKITEDDVCRKYSEATGKQPHMVKRHYFKDRQFEIPTENIWNLVFAPLGFTFNGIDGTGYDSLSTSYKELKGSYEKLRNSYDALRPYHRCDPMHNNVWNRPPIPSNKRWHTCEKPLDLLQRIIRVSCPPGGLVIDPFMGSASTGIACLNESSHFVGIEKDDATFETAKRRINERKRPQTEEMQNI